MTEPVRHPTELLVQNRSGSALTPRELDVLVLLAEGLSNREIATRLVLSVHTVEFHATRLYAKLGVRNRTEAAIAAQRLLAGNPSISEAAAPIEPRNSRAPQDNDLATLRGTSPQGRLAMRSIGSISNSIRRRRVALAVVASVVITSSLGAGIAYAELFWPSPFVGCATVNDYGLPASEHHGTLVMERGMKDGVEYSDLRWCFKTQKEVLEYLRIDTSLPYPENYYAPRTDGRPGLPRP